MCWRKGGSWRCARSPGQTCALLCAELGAVMVTKDQRSFSVPHPHPTVSLWKTTLRNLCSQGTRAGARSPRSCGDSGLWEQDSLGTRCSEPSGSGPRQEGPPPPPFGSSTLQGTGCDRSLPAAALLTAHLPGQVARVCCRRQLVVE